MKEFKIWLDEKTGIVEEKLNKIIEEKNNPQKIIYEAMNYSLLCGGKRLRPVLMLGAYELFDGNYERVLPFACAMEMIHTYSLIHDDLPAMDNDDYRRGKLSNHKMYGEATAILAGDGLLNKAFETGLEAVIEFDMDIKRAMRALLEIAKSSGSEGMIGGQVVDIFGNDKINDIHSLEYMYSLKTGAIIKSSIVAGAILGGAGEEEIQVLSTYAEKLGLAFQIEDDILDVVGNKEKLGKLTGSDAANHKTTYLSFMPLNEAKNKVKELTGEAIGALGMFGTKAGYLAVLAEYLTDRDY